MGVNTQALTWVVVGEYSLEVPFSIRLCLQVHLTQPIKQHYKYINENKMMQPDDNI